MTAAVAQGCCGPSALTGSQAILMTSISPNGSTGLDDIAGAGTQDRLRSGGS